MYSLVMWRYDAEAIPHGFPNLRTIQRSIADLHKHFPGSELLGLKFPSSLSPAIIDATDAEDPIASVKRIVAAIVHHFHLPDSTVVVNFNENMDQPARISQGLGGARIVEIQSKFKASRETVAILAHEIAHYFLIKRDSDTRTRSKTKF